MEYRIFQPIDPLTFQCKWKLRTDLEQRTDIYILLLPSSSSDQTLQSIEHGLKLRHQRYLELKIRQNRLPNGQEHWIKTVQAFHKFGPQDIPSIERALRQANQLKLAEQVNSSPPEILCYVEKYQERKKTVRSGYLESTGLRLQYRHLHDLSAFGPNLFFETFCFESSPSKVISDEFLREIFSERNLDISHPMGYPEFLMKQYEAINTS